MHFLDLTLGIRFEPVLGGLSRLKEMAPDTSMPMARSSKDDFFSQLTQDAITEEQYCHAIKVWGTFNSQTMGDYHDLYLKSDILLLADVFENFRSTCLQYHKLDPFHYVTSPGLSWDAMLKMTDIKLE